MKVNEIIDLNETSATLDKLKKFAKAHYSDTETEEEALLTLFARSLKHAEDDDHRQDVEIDQLKQEVDKIKRSSNQSVQHQVPKSI